jgi:galactose mutarotase-like enzyme
MERRDVSDERHTVRSERITATILAHGAELCSLKTADGLELLWQAGPEWPRHSPLLFPIIGEVRNEQIRVRGKLYKMLRHGVARDHDFTFVERSPQSCKLVQTDNEETRARFPFAYRLTLTYTLRDAHLDLALAIENPGDEILPCSIGGHPALHWPLLPGVPKESYRLTFSHDEPAPIRRLKDGLLLPDPKPSPIRGRVLDLSERLFDEDAIILDRLASTAVCYAAEKGPTLEVSWDGFRQLGIWSKPGGAPFLCIEPWYGFASPVDFDGEFSDKPGLMHIPPGQTRSFRYTIGVHA